MKKQTREQFIEKAIEIHGTKYDYTNVVYEKSHIPVKIKCLRHGEFLKRPSMHLIGQGCKKCSYASRKGKPKRTTAEFTALAIAKHGDRYAYDKVDYIRGNQKVILTCKDHGDFEQAPMKHLAGRGCPLCADHQRNSERKLSTKDFIKKARAIHGDIYNYSMVRYRTFHEKVSIRCKEHDFFDQTPASHLRGAGCPDCGLMKRAKSQSLGQDEFLSRVKTIFGNQYVYSSAVFKNVHERVELYCLKKGHGQFTRPPSELFNGHGCQKCGFEEGSEKQAMGLQKFAKKAHEKHGGQYQYDQSIYKNNNTPIEIYCPDHGYFWQTPANHLVGKKCRKCSGRLIENTEQFIDAATQLHNDRYTYERAKYVRANRRTVITCPDHGDFDQTPNAHLAGKGCNKCQGHGLSTEEWVARANEIHFNRYDYSRTNFVDSTTDVMIGCNAHGFFLQDPVGHTQGRGCRKCADEIRVLGSTIQDIALNGSEILGRLYVLNIFSDEENFFKIGITSKSVKQRWKNLPEEYDYEILADLHMNIVKAYQLEQSLLIELESHRYIPKTYFGGITECLTKNPIELNHELEVLTSEDDKQDWDKYDVLARKR